MEKVKINQLNSKQLDYLHLLVKHVQPMSKGLLDKDEYIMLSSRLEVSPLLEKLFNRRTETNFLT